MLRGLKPLSSLRPTAASVFGASTYTSKTSRIYPLPHMYVVKDLVPDMTLFYQQYASVQPWIQREAPFTIGEKQLHQSVGEREKLLRYILPSVFPVNEPKMAPSLTRSIAVEAPPHRVFEKLDPIGHLVPVSEPPSSFANKAPVSAASAGRRLLIIRRKKMNKFKYKKRLKRDHFLLQKRHMKRKLKAEALFRSRMKVLRDDLAAFNPMEYVKNTIASAEREWEQNLAPTGRKKHGHWSEVISLEELYGVEKSEYIDKRAGLITSPEDRAKFESQRAEYFQKYMRKRPKSPRDDGGGGEKPTGNEREE